MEGQGSRLLKPVSMSSAWLLAFAFGVCKTTVFGEDRGYLYLCKFICIFAGTIKEIYRRVEFKKEFLFLNIALESKGE